MDSSLSEADHTIIRERVHGVFPKRKLRACWTGRVVAEAAEAALQAISWLPIPSESSMKGGG